jgi:hypothetical protein
LLHRLCAQPKFKQLIEAQVSGRDVIDLLLQSAQLEFKVRAPCSSRRGGNDAQYGGQIDNNQSFPNG